ncbi:MAG: tetratricopeptide repeat protein [Arenibacterium sp.]
MLVLAACDTAEERAEGHYQTGLALLSDGDVDRALIEFRNVFDLNPRHRDARAAYAKAQRDRGLVREAYGQYLRLVEQFPDDLEGRVALAQMALDSQNWPEVERHATHAHGLAPDDLVVKSLYNTLQYFNALQDEDESRKAELAAEALELVSSDGDLSASRRVLIDSLIQSGKFEDALVQIDEGVRVSPQDLTLYILKLGILRQTGDTDAIRMQLETMTEVFPENDQVKQSLVAFYVGQQDLDGAEALLRADAEESDDVALTRTLLAFIAQYRGLDATVVELNRILDAGRLPSATFTAMLARLEFDQGDRDGAIADLVAASEDAERTPELRDLEVELARMYFQTGNSVAARQLVEKVLEEDDSHPGGIKLKASWLIEDDETGDAIVLLREALRSAPRDTDLLTLMAQAHEREGNRELMSEMLALAVEASSNRPAETLRYARYLASEDQTTAAEGLIIDALRLSPTNLDLLNALGALYIRMENWSQARDVVTRLEEFGDETSTAIASSLMAQILASQERSEELIELLKMVAEDPNTKRPAQISLFRTLLATEGPAAALDYVEGLLGETPDDPELRFLKAGVLVGLDRQDEALGMYRQLVEEQADRTSVWVNLYRIARLNGDIEGASSVLNEALSKMPDDPTLRVALADELAAAGEVDEAISIYEELYEESSNSVVIANNLASLLADNRDDLESIERAYAIARRLRGAEVPALQDTYGWIAFRMGNIEEAEGYLSSAAGGMPANPVVQYHYGKVLAALGRNDEALEQFNKVLEMVDETDTSAYLTDLREEVEKIQNPNAE